MTAEYHKWLNDYRFRNASIRKRQCGNGFGRYVGAPGHAPNFQTGEGNP